MHKDMHCQAGDSMAVSLTTLFDSVNCTHGLKSRRWRAGDFACANGEWRMAA
jgi:hypothetical protein